MGSVEGKSRRKYVRGGVKKVKERRQEEIGLMKREN